MDLKNLVNYCQNLLEGVDNEQILSEEEQVSNFIYKRKVEMLEARDLPAGRTPKKQAEIEGKRTMRKAVERGVEKPARAASSDYRRRRREFEGGREAQVAAEKNRSAGGGVLGASNKKVSDAAGAEKETENRSAPR